jgi:hypothetical protein
LSFGYCRRERAVAHELHPRTNDLSEVLEPQTGASDRRLRFTSVKPSNSDSLLRFDASGLGTERHRAAIERAGHLHQSNKKIAVKI